MTSERRASRRASAPVLFGLAMMAASIAAQSPATDFSGRWALSSASPARPGFDAFWLGTEAVVKQTGTTLTITRVSPPPEREATFQLDGSESENIYTIDGVRQIKSSRTSIGATLLISTDTTSPDGRRWLSHINRWSLDPGGDLLVTDTEICGKGECPSIVTNVRYRKKQASAASYRLCPIAYRNLSVRMKIWPSEIAGELSVYSPRSFSASIANFGPAWMTLVTPSSSVM